LGSQKIGTGAEGVRAARQTQEIRTDGNADIGSGVKNSALRGIGNSVAKLGITEADRVREGSGIEIQTDGMHRRVVHVGEGLKAVGDEPLGAVVLLIGKAVKNPVVVADVPIELGHAVGVTER